MPSLAFHLNCKAQLFGTLDIELTRGNFNLQSLGFRRIVTPDFRGNFVLDEILHRALAIIAAAVISRSMNPSARARSSIKYLRIIEELINPERSSRS